MGIAGSSIPLSSCPGDTKLEGLNYLKGQAPVLALPDDQYPEWLWSILTPKVYPDDGPSGKAERVKRRAENKQRIKDRNFMSTQ
jgi:large subunit ribosomal protein L54